MYTNNTDNQQKQSKTVGFVLLSPDEQVLGYLNIPVYIASDVRETILTAQRNLGIIVRPANEPRTSNIDISFLTTK